MQQLVKPQYSEASTIHFPFNNEWATTAIQATTRNGAGTSRKPPTKPAPMALPPLDVAKSINTKKTTMSATKNKASLDASPSLNVWLDWASPAFSHSARLDSISFPLKRTGAAHSWQISDLARFDASQTRHLQSYWGMLWFNVGGNRTATLAAKPPPAVAGPCWPTS